MFAASGVVVVRFFADERYLENSSSPETSASGDKRYREVCFQKTEMKQIMHLSFEVAAGRRRRR